LQFILNNYASQVGGEESIKLVLSIGALVQIPTSNLFASFFFVLIHKFFLFYLYFARKIKKYVILFLVTLLKNLKKYVSFV
jgi:hypothetical protein